MTTTLAAVPAGAAPARGDVVFVLPNVMGGMLNIVEWLAAEQPAALPARVVFTDNAHSRDTRFAGALTAGTPQQVVHHQLPSENLHAVLQRLRRAIGEGPGVLVCNDLLELALLHCWRTRRMVVQLLHGDHAYYYDLAVTHQEVVDVFISYGRAMYEELCKRLPQRRADIYYLPYGVTLPARQRVPAARLRAVFAGRIEQQQKGVFDLPLIDEALLARGVTIDWTVIGDGPDAAALRERWRRPDIVWRGHLPREHVLQTLPDHDVFVLPTRAEGVPLALVEAMGAGLVPVASDLASGVRELVDDHVSGFCIPVGDLAVPAARLQFLAEQRDVLESMSRAATARVRHEFSPTARAREYQALFAEWQSRARRPRTEAPLPYGSRLDQRWLPNVLVRSVRFAVRQWGGAR